jgi:hypothetical protein
LAFLGSVVSKAPGQPNQRQLEAGIISLALIDGAAFSRKIAELRQRISSLQGSVGELQRLGNEIGHGLKAVADEAGKLSALAVGAVPETLAVQVGALGEVCTQGATWLQEMEVLRTTLVAAANKAKGVLETAGDWPAAQGTLTAARAQTQDLLESNRRLEQQAQRFSNVGTVRAGLPGLQNSVRQIETSDNALNQRFGRVLGNARQFDNDRVLALAEKSAIFGELRTYRGLLDDANPLAREFAELSRDLQGAVLPDNPLTGASGSETRASVEAARRKAIQQKQTVEKLATQLEACEKQQPPASQQAQKAAGFRDETTRAWQECRGALAARVERKHLEGLEVDKVLIKRRQQASDTGTRVQGLKQRETERVDLLKKRISAEDKTRLTKELEAIRTQLQDNSKFLANVQKNIQDQEQKARDLPQEVAFLNAWNL